MISVGRIAAVLIKELRHLSRDRITIAMIIGMPIIQIMIYGFAINQDVRNLDAAYADMANTSASRQYIAELQNSQVLNFKQAVATPDELETLLRNGTVDAGLIIPYDFERRLVDPEHSRSLAQLLVNGTHIIVVNVTSALRDFPFDAHKGTHIDRNRVPPIAIRVLYNTEKRSAVFVLPALIGVILTMTMTIFTAIAIVRERERGNLEFLIATPVLNIELMMGKIIPYMGIGLLQTTLILAISISVFDVPMRGDLFDLYVASMVFICASLALGLIISTLAKTQFQAMQMTLFFFLPQVLMSGFIFPFEGMPKSVQYLAETFPLTHFVRLSRGIILRGASVWELWSEIAALLLFFVIALFIASLRFRKKLD
ncbi:MAG: ABC-2 type transport system permease protein [Cellvibrionaceae bacterium]|jgi:ABC-2 type transport system permease protein